METVLRTAQEELARGSALTMTSAGDASANFLVQQAARTRIEQILFALNALNPTDYPLSQIKRVNRTKMKIYQGQEESV